jgi:hypothetical protein
MKSIPGVLERAEKSGDTVIKHIADYIRSDERTHVRHGQKIIKTMTDLDMPTLVLETRKAFTSCLITLGVIPANGDSGFVLSREDIEKFIGE